jgi:hypothetical protein
MTSQQNKVDSKKIINELQYVLDYNRSNHYSNSHNYHILNINNSYSYNKFQTISFFKMFNFEEDKEIMLTKVLSSIDKKYISDNEYLYILKESNLLNQLITQLISQSSQLSSEMKNQFLDYILDFPKKSMSLSTHYLQIDNFEKIIEMNESFKETSQIDFKNLLSFKIQEKEFSPIVRLIPYLPSKRTIPFLKQLIENKQLAIEDVNKNGNYNFLKLIIQNEQPLLAIELIELFKISVKDNFNLILNCKTIESFTILMEKFQINIYSLNDSEITKKISNLPYGVEATEIIKKYISQKDIDQSSTESFIAIFATKNKAEIIDYLKTNKVSWKSILKEPTFFKSLLEKNNPWWIIPIIQKEIKPDDQLFAGYNLFNLLTLAPYTYDNLNHFNNFAGYLPLIMNEDYIKESLKQTSQIIKNAVSLPELCMPDLNTNSPVKMQNSIYQHSSYFLRQYQMRESYNGFRSAAISSEIIKHISEKNRIIEKTYEGFINQIFIVRKNSNINTNFANYMITQTLLADKYDVELNFLDMIPDNKKTTSKLESNDSINIFLTALFVELNVFQNHSPDLYELSSKKCYSLLGHHIDNFLDDKKRTLDSFPQSFITNLFSQIKFLTHSLNTKVDIIDDKLWQKIDKVLQLNTEDVEKKSFKNIDPDLLQEVQSLCEASRLKSMMNTNNPAKTNKSNLKF